MNFEIRRAVPEDAPDLLALIEAHAAFERAHAGIGERRLGELLASDQAPVTIWVASTPELVGYAALTTDFSLWRGRYWAHLDCLFVRDAWRGQGCGRELLATARSAARADGADRLEWQTPSWNEPAIRFYRREGAIAADKARFCMTL